MHQPGKSAEGDPAAHGLAPFDDDEPMSKLRYLDATLEACP